MLEAPRRFRSDAVLGVADQQDHDPNGRAGVAHRPRAEPGVVADADGKPGPVVLQVEVDADAGGLAGHARALSGRQGPDHESGTALHPLDAHIRRIQQPG